MQIQVDYDAETNAAYLYLVPIERRQAVRSLSVPHEGIVLDFSKENTLIGIEVLQARARLPARVLGAGLMAAHDESSPDIVSEVKQHVTDLPISDVNPLKPGE